MSKRNFHSVPKDGEWAVKQEGKPTPVSIHRTQSAAEAMTRRLAKQAEGEAVFHKRDGQIKDKDSFGPDPNPPKDKVH
jgi:hypothetical protein